MLYKCNYCDPTTKRGQKPVKSVDTDKHDFIKDERSKYYHLECYKKHLIERKKITKKEEIEDISNKLLEKSKLESIESNQRDKFLKWVIEFYDGSLPPYFLKKLKSVREGTYEGLREQISYETLLDIYSYMKNYLEKLAAKKKIEKIGQRMNYDLAVVIGNYEDYKKFKQKQSGFSADKNEIERQIKVESKVNKISKENYKEKEKDEFDITDIMDELLL